MNLVEMKQFANSANHNIKYFFSVIDVFSKYLWVKMLPNKKTPTVLKVLQQVINEARKMTNQSLLDMSIYEGCRNSELNKNKKTTQIKKKVIENLKNVNGPPKLNVSIPQIL
jgi:hypothetical protein